MEIAAVIVTYNRQALLEQCLQAVVQQKPVAPDILVFDNASSDGTQQMMQQKYTESFIRYYRSEKNLGGAGGFCRAIEMAVSLGYKKLWIMDDDTLPQQAALQRLLAADSAQEGAYGFLGSRVLWKDGQPCVMNRQRDTIFRDVPDTAQGLTPVVMSSFVSLFLDAARVRELGLPIEDFFIWCDDWEYTRRISLRYPCYLVPDSIVIHAMQSNTPVNIATDAPGRLDRYRYFYRNDVVLFRREGPVGWAYLVVKDLWHSLQVLWSGRQRLKKLGIIWSGFFRGVFFFPAIRRLSPGGEETQN
mgnify:CR=1 FL=1